MWPNSQNLISRVAMSKVLSEVRVGMSWVADDRGGARKISKQQGLVAMSRC
jgi:hypothetical protein